MDRLARQVNYGVLFPDRDGDGVRDDLDAWPDSRLFSQDANGNGIPDNADAAYGIGGRSGSDAVTVGGVPTTIAQALLAGSFTGLAEALTTTTTTSTTSTTTTSTTSTTTTTSSTTSTTLPANIAFVPGWNLVGNGAEATIAVATAFNDTARVATVWKWVTSGTTASIAYPAWAFYTPSLGDGGQAYAASKGYDFLTTINAGEGFWVNAKTAFVVPLPAGAAVLSPSFMPALASPATAGGAHALPRGWSLIATGDGPTPSQFDAAIATAHSAQPATGQVYTNLTTLWAWDAAHAGWYFWAPSLVNNAGLAGYLTNKGYLDFSTLPAEPPGTLAPTTGFWVNMP